MRTQEQLNSKEFQDDMTELKELLDKEGIEYTFGRHEGADLKVKELIGYYPTGEWHLRVGKNSIIRGMVSFGDYEILGEKDDDPIRFETAPEMFEEIKRRIKTTLPKVGGISKRKRYEEKKCQISPLYGKDNNKTLHFYCDYCGKEIGYDKNRICKAKREQCKNCGEDIGDSDRNVGVCLNCKNKLNQL